MNIQNEIKNQEEILILDPEEGIRHLFSVISSKKKFGRSFLFSRK